MNKIIIFSLSKSFSYENIKMVKKDEFNKKISEKCVDKKCNIIKKYFNSNTIL